MSLDAAAFDDPRFERLPAAARAVFEELEQVRSDKELVAAWNECFSRWLPERGRPVGAPGGWAADVAVRELEIVTLHNAGAASDAEGVVRARVRVREWWRVLAVLRAFPRRDAVLWLTFIAAPGSDWELTRVDSGRDGEYHLASETVTEPERDPALHDAAVHELAEADAVDRLRIGADEQLLDLSLTDGRFAPAVVEASVRSLIRAWRQLTIAEEEGYHAFAALSSYEIAEYARHADLPARLQGIEVLALVPTPRPALFLRIAAVVQVDDGAHERKLWWKLELDDELEEHWRLVDAYARPELRELRAH